MKAILLTIGNEVLNGQVVDTNAAWIAQQLLAQGVPVKEKWSVSDTIEAIRDGLTHSARRGELIITTGGLGPTADDLTCEALAQYMGVKRIFHEATFENLRKIFAGFHREPGLQHREQCTLPDGVTILPNSAGTAPGMYCKVNDVHIIALPGVPFEMKAIFDPHVIDLLREIKSGPRRISHTFNTVGEGETVLEELLRPITSALPTNVGFAFLPDIYRVRIRVDLDSESEADYQAWLSTLELVRTALKTYLVGENEITLEVAIGQLLQKRNWMLATAESCTGGYLAHLITSISGASMYYKGSIVAYHNAIKEGLLYVDKATLDEYGSVSEETVIAMAQGALKSLDTQVAVSISGIAGPGGGTASKPVGLVWLALADTNGRLKTYKINRSRDRSINIRGAAVMALILLHRFLLPE